MALRDRIARKQGRGPFVVAVLVFPDMEPDPTLQRALAGLTKIEQRPTTADIQRKVALIECATPEPETPEMSEMGLHSGQVVIQHAATVNVYSQVPAPLPEGDRMDRADRIQLGRHLLDRAEADRHTPEIGGLLAARWASAAFAHALMAHSGEVAGLGVRDEDLVGLFPDEVRLAGDGGGRAPPLLRLT